MPMNNLAILSIYRSTGEVSGSLWKFWIELFLACHRTRGIFLSIAGM